MASISVVGCPPYSPTLSDRRTSFSSLRRRFTGWYGCQSLQEPEKQSHSRSLNSPRGGIERSGNGYGALAVERRSVLVSWVGIVVGALWNASENGPGLVASASDFADMPALRGKDYGKTRMSYPDYSATDSGLQYKDLRAGNGPMPKIGDTVVVDWDGYTIGYYGRIFEARNKTKGGSFEGDDKEFFKFRVGSQEFCRIIVPPELGYPENDFNKRGPRPTTFSGQRALDFVLRNQGLIDKTLLFDIELLKIIPN